MNKEEIYKFLDNKNIKYEITNHKAVYNMDELNDVELPYKEDAKNLFLKDDKKNYYLVTVKGEVKVDLKEFRRRNNTRPLHFAKPEDLMELLNLIPGAVTPLGLLNDKDLKVKFYIDKSFFSKQHRIGVHPNDNTATIWLKVDDLVEIIEEHGNEVNVFTVK